MILLHLSWYILSAGVPYIMCWYDGENFALFLGYFVAKCQVEFLFLSGWPCLKITSIDFFFLAKKLNSMLLKFMYVQGEKCSVILKWRGEVLGECWLPMAKMSNYWKTRWKFVPAKVHTNSRQGPSTYYIRYIQSHILGEYGSGVWRKV